MNKKMWLCLLLISAMSSFGSANTIVAPAGYENVAAPSGNGAPFSQIDSRYQQVYGAADLTAMVGRSITGIAFRIDEDDSVDGDYAGGLFKTLEVRLSTTPLAVDSLTTNFGGNHGPDVTVVRNATAYAIPALEGDLAVNPFDLKIQFDTPFLYSGGNLLVDLIRTSDQFIHDTIPQLLDAVNATDSVNRVFVDNAGFPQTGQDSVGLVTQFEFTPEPGSCAMLLCGAVALIAGGRRTRVGSAI